MLTYIKKLHLKIADSVHFVPTDLLEYPTISYFQYRNNGDFQDFQVSPKMIDKYLPYYKKNPREIFHISNDDLEIHWTEKSKRGFFHHSIGSAISPYKPISPSILENCKCNPIRNLYVHRYLKNDRNIINSTALLFIHGYAESHFIFHEQFYFRMFYDKFKTDIYALELPYHHKREPKDSPFSGAYFLNGNPVRMLEAFRQSIIEINLIVNQLKKQYERVILFGISLGGHLVALSTQLLSEIDIISALAGPFLFRLATKTKIVPVANNYITQHKEQGLTSYYKILYPTNLKYFQPLTTNENTAIIGGAYDRIVPFDFVQDLSQTLQKPLYSYPGGHLTLLIWLRSLLSKIENYWNH
jgi:hypothetical protein